MASHADAGIPGAGKFRPALEVGPVRRPELLQAVLVDYEISAIDETTRPDAWVVFFATDTDRDAATQTLARQFPDLSMTSVDVADEDWVARSQATLTAVQIGHTIVAPPWDLPDADGGALVIQIRPSMGFGTGHHATTRLCLLALQQIDLRGRSVIDIGTGSGLLAIAASRLGAGRVLAIDDDPDALHAAQENIGVNRGADVTLRQADIRSVTVEPFDVVIANLTAALLREAATRLHGLAAPGAHLVLGGFMRGDEADVLAAYADLTVTGRAEEEQWVCVTLQRG